MSNNINEIFPSSLGGMRVEGRCVICGSTNSRYIYDSKLPNQLAFMYCYHCGQEQPHSEIKKIENY